MSEIKSMLNESVFEQDAPEQKDNAAEADKEETIEEAMRKLGKTKEDVEAAILQLVEKGRYEERRTILGKIDVLFATPPAGYSDAVYHLMEKFPDATMNVFEFKFGLYSLAAALEEYQGKNMTEAARQAVIVKQYDGNEEAFSKLPPEKQFELILEEKANVIEATIPLPIFQHLANASSDFHKFVHWLGTKDVYDFLSIKST